VIGFKTVFGCLFACGGPCLIVYGVVSYFRTQSFIRRSAEARGEVIRLEHSKDRMGTTSYESYALVFSFIAANGKKFTVASDVWSSPADFSIGESVRVLYDPANSEDARIHTFFQTSGTAVITGVAGLGFAVAGSYFVGLHF